MTDRMKPPARRAGGRPLGGAKQATPPPPPPTAELTPEQFAAEGASAQDEGRSATSTPRIQAPPSSPPAESAAQGSTETTPGGTESAGEPVDLLAPQEVSTPEPAESPQQGPSRITSAASAPLLSAEVAVRATAPTSAGRTVFPVGTDWPGSDQEQEAQSYEAPSEGTPYAHGPGRPKGIPEAAVVLNQRIITRESLDSSVPAALKLKKRLKRFALDSELDHLPIGDIVSVALDEWLTHRGF